MKVISKKDLMILLPKLQNMSDLSLKDFENLLDAYGDEWFFDGNELVKTKENEIMAKIRILEEEK